MRARAANAYANTQVQTGVAASSPGDLIILVYERVFDHLKMGKLAIENGEYGMDSFTKAHDLIQQGLLACIDFQEGGDIAESLAAVYEWSLREIISARTTKSAEKVQGVIDVLSPLYEGWLELAPKNVIANLSAEMGDQADTKYQRQVTNQ